MSTFHRRQFNRLLLGAAVAGALPASVFAATGASPRARSVYERALVIDGCGLPGGFEPDAKPESESSGLTDWMLRDCKNAGVTAINITVGAVGNGPGTFEDTVAGIAQFEHELTLHPDVLLKVLRASDLRAAKDSGRVGLIYGFQDASMLGSDIDRVDLFHKLGVRILQPTYNTRNLLGDGCLEEADAGLSRFGHQVIERMNALGILLDLSHCGQRTAHDAIVASKAPMAFTHSGCRALVDVPRNRTDAELRLVAERGGVTGIYFMPFLRTAGQQTSADALRHIEHAIDACGEDHVGIGTDGFVSHTELNDAYRARHKQFVEERRKRGISAPGEDENVFNFLTDIDTPRRLETLADQLLARGHGESRVEKILGGNFARVMKDVWK